MSCLYKLIVLLSTLYRTVLGFAPPCNLTTVTALAQVDVHLTKFIDDLTLRQTEPPVPSVTHTHAHAHTSSQDSAQPHTTALSLPLVLPETHSQQDSTAVAGHTQAGAGVTVASRGQVMFLCEQGTTLLQASFSNDTWGNRILSLRQACCVCNVYTVHEEGL